MAALERVEVLTGESPRKSVIWLHGLGADGHDFEPIVPELGLPDAAAVRFVFPHAPVRPVTLNGGMAMRAWYDIVSLDRNGPADEEGMRQSMASVDTLITEQLDAGLSAGDIVLAGFSQGGAIALSSGLRYPARLAGVMALSTYLPMQASLATEASDANRSLPIFLAHGTYDPVLPFMLGTQAREVLEKGGYPVQWQEYGMAHQVCLEEIRDIGAWLTKVLEL